jgi:hypothetical protein
MKTTSEDVFGIPSVNSPSANANHLHMRFFLVLLILLSASVAISQAQTAQKDLADFFGKKWVTSEYEIHGERHSATDILAGDGSIFNADGTFSSVDKGIASKGKWTYDAQKRILIAYTEGYDDPNRLKVISISSDTAVLESVHEGEASADHKHHAMIIYLSTKN